MTDFSGVDRAAPHTAWFFASHPPAPSGKDALARLRSLSMRELIPAALDEAAHCQRREPLLEILQMHQASVERSAEAVRQAHGLAPQYRAALPPPAQDLSLPAHATRVGELGCPAVQALLERLAASRDQVLTDCVDRPRDLSDPYPREQYDPWATEFENDTHARCDRADHATLAAQEMLLASLSHLAQEGAPLGDDPLLLALEQSHRNHVALEGMEIASMLRSDAYRSLDPFALVHGEEELHGPRIDARVHALERAMLETVRNAAIARGAEVFRLWRDVEETGTVDVPHSLLLQLYDALSFIQLLEEMVGRYPEHPGEGQQLLSPEQLQALNLQVGADALASVYAKWAYALASAETLQVDLLDALDDISREWSYIQHYPLFHHLIETQKGLQSSSEAARRACFAVWGGSRLDDPGAGATEQSAGTVLDPQTAPSSGAPPEAQFDPLLNPLVKLRADGAQSLGAFMRAFAQLRGLMQGDRADGTAPEEFREIYKAARSAFERMDLMMERRVSMDEAGSPIQQLIDRTRCYAVLRSGAGLTSEQRCHANLFSREAETRSFLDLDQWIRSLFAVSVG